MPKIDDHHLRYAALTQAIERILFRRTMEQKLEGYTLETAIEIAEMLQPADLDMSDTSAATDI